MEYLFDSSIYCMRISFSVWEYLSGSTSPGVHVLEYLLLPPCLDVTVNVLSFGVSVWRYGNLVGVHGYLELSTYNYETGYYELDLGV